MEKEVMENNDEVIEEPKDMPQYFYESCFKLLKLYLKLGIVRCEDSEALLHRALSNEITNEERKFLRGIYFG